MRCLMRYAPSGVFVLLAASWIVQAASAAPAPPEIVAPRDKNAWIDNNRVFLEAAGDFLKKCDVPAYINVTDQDFSLLESCIYPAVLQGGWEQSMCTPVCRDSRNMFESKEPGCEIADDITTALLAKNITNAFLVNGTLPKGAEADWLTTFVQINDPDFADDFFTSEKDGVSVFANRTLSTYLVIVASILTEPSFAEYYLGCTNFPIEDISESTVLNVTRDRTQEEEDALDLFREQVGKFRSQLLEEFSIWLPAQCRGNEYVAPSYDYLELMIKCANILGEDSYMYPSAEATCPEECIQFSTISEKELPNCQIAEDLLMSQLGFQWAQMFLQKGELPSDGTPEQGSQKLFVDMWNVNEQTEYPADMFDQNNLREEIAGNFTRAIPFLQFTTLDLSTQFAVNYYLGCYRKDPKVTPMTAPGEIDQMSPERSGAILMSPISAGIVALWFMVL